MHRASLPVVVLLAVACGSLAFAGIGAAAPPAAASGAVRRVCATPEPTNTERAAVRFEMDRAALRFGAPASGGGTIQVAFHVITDGAEGAVTDRQIADQIQVLNRAYSGTGYRFVLSSVDRTNAGKWFKMGTGAEKNAKQALAIDPAHHLNVYTCKPGHFILGWAYFPFSFPEDYYLHGVVMHYGTVPGGNAAPYNQGGTLVHEVGHYLGLFHTFQGGCDAPGDEVDDTPFEASPAFGCPAGRNTCPQPGDDPIHNYMDYTDDACYTEFTSGQDARMDAIVPIYRPSLFANLAQASAIDEATPAAVSPPALRGPEFRGGMPNPFQDQTTFRFYLPRSEPVSLRIYNVAGQRVATVIDAVLPEGDHSALFQPGRLSAGTYFAVLRAGSIQLHRSIVLVR